MKEFFADHMPEHVNGVHMMIAAFDDNGDDKINMDEAMKMAQAKGEGMKTIMANYMFKNTGDQNGDGFVSKHEYHTAMMCLGMGPDLTERYMNEDFAKYDADGDEQMNFEEFKVRFTLIKWQRVNSGLKFSVSLRLQQRTSATVPRLAVSTYISPSEGEASNSLVDWVLSSL